MGNFPSVKITSNIAPVILGGFMKWFEVSILVKPVQSTMLLKGIKSYCKDFIQHIELLTFILKNRYKLLK